MAILNEAVLEYSVVLKDQALTTLSNFQTILDRVNDSASDFGKIFTGGQDLTSFFKGFVSGANDLTNLAKATGYSTDQLQEWSYAAKSVGVDSNTVLGDMKHLKSSFAMGEKDLLRLSQTFSRSSRFYSQQMGQYLGLSQDMINLLREGPEALQAMFDEAHNMGAVVSGEKIKEAADAQREWNKTMAAFQGNAQQVIAEILPTINEWLGKLNDLMKEHPEETLKHIGTSLKVIAGISMAAWAADKINKFSQLLKVLNNTQTAVEGMSNAYVNGIANMAQQKGTIGAIGSSLKGLSGTISLLGNAITTLSMAFTTLELGQALGKWLGLDDEKNPIGKWFAEAGEDAGDLFYGLYKLFKGDKGDLSKMSPEELNAMRIKGGIAPAPTQPNVTNNTSSDNSVTTNSQTVIYNVTGDSVPGQTIMQNQ